MTKYEDALEDLDLYLEAASGHSCGWCPAPTDEELSKAIRAHSVLKEALSKAEQFDKMVEARKKATAGEWYKVGLPWNTQSPYIIAGHHDPHVGKAILDVIDPDQYTGEDDEDIRQQEIQEEMDQHGNCDFITTTANILEPYARKQCSTKQ